MRSDEVRLVRGRLRFNESAPAPFPSAVVVFRGGDRPAFSAIAAP